MLKAEASEAEGRTITMEAREVWAVVLAMRLASHETAESAQADVMEAITQALAEPEVQAEAEPDSLRTDRTARSPD